MDWTELNTWLSLLANLGVIAGLVLVAIQIRQNTGITRAQMTNEQWKDRIGYLQWHLGNEVGRRWWKHFRQEFPADFAAMVDKSLEEGQQRSNMAALNALIGAEQASQG